MRCFDYPEPYTLIVFREMGHVVVDEPLTETELKIWLDMAMMEPDVKEVMVIKHGVEVRTVKRKIRV